MMSLFAMDDVFRPQILNFSVILMSFMFVSTIENATVQRLSNKHCFARDLLRNPRKTGGRHE